MRRSERNREPETPWTGPMPAWANGRRNRQPRRRRLRSRTALLLAVGAIATVVYAASPEPWRSGGAEPIVGRAGRIVDGDTLDFAGYRIRLAGLDAPELAQTCRAASGRDWPCGEAARTALRALAAGTDLRCLPSGSDRYGRTLATCRAGDVDLAEAMVGQGLALASGPYAAAEAEARSARRGLWAGAFVAPADWRRQNRREDAQTTATPSRFESFIRWLLEAMNG